MSRSPTHTSPRGLLLLLGLALSLSLLGARYLVAQEDMPKVDAALILSVDTSSSVDEKRYHLQMEGIAAALEDDNVIKTILGGANGSILISMVTWADKSKLAVPWTTISNANQAKALAMTIRNLPQQEGEFTCLARMLRYVADKVVARLPARAEKIVIDVSGDGPDNCNTGQLLETSQRRSVRQRRRRSTACRSWKARMRCRSRITTRTTSSAGPALSLSRPRGLRISRAPSARNSSSRSAPTSRAADIAAAQNCS